MSTRWGPTVQKVLLLLLGGVTLGLSGSPGRYARVLKSISSEWKKIDQRALYRAIRELYRSKLISYKEHKDGSVEMILTIEGKEIALRYKPQEMKIARPAKWDSRWRVIIFDIPEDIKKLRDTLRLNFKRLGLVELQKSVFVHPFECRKEIDFIIELYDARRYVRFIEANYIDNELFLKKKFKII